ncbi:MAG: SDR family NAD(P)-dependent oxidoreductase [Patescibacteria group bacterium]|nr:SDR family NAD(P)-dependent oxidoreductase [Patescibacteria group bacterium]
MAKILVTGGAGFIGSAVSRALLQRGDAVVIVDNFNDYYDPALKEARVQHLLNEFKPEIIRADIADQKTLAQVFKQHRFDRICHLAAQAGVRYSLENPHVYSQTNVVGTLNLLELARNHGNPPFVFASSSSVYGGNVKLPFSEADPVDQPLSLYGATKRSCELMAYTYHHLFNLPCTGLRFFTVYGPWGRPDMAYFSFTRDILAGKTIKLFNRGKMARDFTYIDDIVRGVVAAIDHPFPYELINLGNHRPVPLQDFMQTLESALGVKAKIELAPMHPSDFVQNFADVAKAKRCLGWQPTTLLAEGIEKFVVWYREFYRV